jgi:xanthine dehydrogenase accessory factor
MNYAKAWARLDEMGHGFREAIVQHASDLIQTILGQRFLVDHLGQLAGFWPEPPTMDQLELVRNSKATLQRPVTVSGVSVIQWPQRIQVVIVGAGHVGQAVAELAQRANFEVVVVDDRAQFANFERFPKATEIHVGPFQEILTNIEITSRTYLLIVTRGHGHDQEALGLVAATPAAYVGLIGSRRKIKMITESLQSEGLASDSLARVKAPIGLPIGSQTISCISADILR